MAAWDYSSFLCILFIDTRLNSNRKVWTWSIVSWDSKSQESADCMHGHGHVMCNMFWYLDRNFCSLKSNHIVLAGVRRTGWKNNTFLKYVIWWICMPVILMLNISVTSRRPNTNWTPGGAWTWEDLMNSPVWQFTTGRTAAAVCSKLKFVKKKNPTKPPNLVWAVLLCTRIFIYIYF